MDYAKIKSALYSDYTSLFELMYFNNPVSLVNSLREMGLTKSVHPDQQEITQIIRRLVQRKDLVDLTKIVSHYAFNSATPNFTTDPAFWKVLGVKYGDFNALANQILV